MGLLSTLFGGKAGPRVNIKKRFALQRKFAQGSMSDVWRATDRKTGRTVCVKVLDKKKTEQLLKRFVGKNRPDEGEIALVMDHPNVIKTYEHGVTTAGEQFLVMEMVDGVNLSLLVETRNPQLRGNELKMMIEAGEGLAHVHEKGFIHRDICPRNFIVTPDGKVLLIDFGLSVPNTPIFRKPGNRTGTVNYMAPELIRRSPTDERIDVFGLGLVAYEAFTGKLPWESTESLQAMIQHLNTPGRDPRELEPDLDDGIARVLMKAIERTPRDRYQSIREFVGELRQLSEQSDG